MSTNDVLPDDPLAAILNDTKASERRLREQRVFERRRILVKARQRQLDDLWAAYDQRHPKMYCRELQRRLTADEHFAAWAGQLKRWGDAVRACGCRARNALHGWRPPEGTSPDSEEGRAAAFTRYIARRAADPRCTAADLENDLRRTRTKENANLLSNLYIHSGWLGRIQEHIETAVQKLPTNPPASESTAAEQPPTVASNDHQPPSPGSPADMRGDGSGPAPAQLSFPPDRLNPSRCPGCKTPVDDELSTRPLVPCSACGRWELHTGLAMMPQTGPPGTAPKVAQLHAPWWQRRLPTGNEKGKPETVQPNAPPNSPNERVPSENPRTPGMSNLEPTHEAEILQHLIAAIGPLVAVVEQHYVGHPYGTEIKPDKQQEMMDCGALVVGLARAVGLPIEPMPPRADYNATTLGPANIPLTRSPVDGKVYLSRREGEEFVTRMQALEHAAEARLSAATRPTPSDAGEPPATDATPGAAEAEETANTAEQIGARSPDKITVAIGILSKHPEWTDRQIADAAGCTAPNLSQSTRWRTAREAVKGIGEEERKSGGKQRGRDKANKHRGTDMDQYADDEE
jgi:hypothetical protein